MPITKSRAYEMTATHDCVGAYHMTLGSRNWVLLIEITGLPEYLVNVKPPSLEKAIC